MKGIFFDRKRRNLYSYNVAELIMKCRFKTFKLGVSVSGSRNFIQSLPQEDLEEFGFGKYVIKYEDKPKILENLIKNGFLTIDNARKEKRKVVVYLSHRGEEYPIALGEIIGDKLVLL